MRNFVVGLLALLGLMVALQPPCRCVDAQERAEKPKAGGGGDKERIPEQPTADDVRKMLRNIEDVITDRRKYDVRDREKALDALGAASSARPQLRRIAEFGINDRDRFIRIDTARAVAAFGPSAQSAAYYIVDGLNDKDATVRCAVAEAVIQIFGGVRLSSDDVILRKMMPSLRRMVKSEPDPDARRAALAALRALGPAAEKAVPELVELAKNDKAGDDRVYALVVLAEIGPAAKRATPVFMKLANDEKRDLRVAALSALGRIAPDDKAALALVMNRLKGTLDDPKLLDDNFVKQGEIGHRQSAVSALYPFGPAAEPAVPLLIRVLEAKDVKDRMVSDTIRCSTLNTLKRIGPGGRSAIPIATKIANDANEAGLVRSAAKHFVEEIE
jgi:HEAT repeat protein